jgi:hypothetical protein
MGGAQGAEVSARHDRHREPERSRGVAIQRTIGRQTIPVLLRRSPPGWTGVFRRLMARNDERDAPSSPAQFRSIGCSASIHKATRARLGASSASANREAAPGRESRQEDRREARPCRLSPSHLWRQSQRRRRRRRLALGHCLERTLGAQGRNARDPAASSPRPALPPQPVCSSAWAKTGTKRASLAGSPAR